MDNQKSDAMSDEAIDQMISFAISEEDYGVDIQTVKEVIRHREITRLPKAPPLRKRCHKPKGRCNTHSRPEGEVRHGAAGIHGHDPGHGCRGRRQVCGDGS